MLSKQALDDATAKFEADQQRANSLDKAFQLAKLGPRAEEIARAKGALQQAEGQAALRKIFARRHGHSRAGNRNDS